jgi:hypothetical protein
MQSATSKLQAFIVRGEGQMLDDKTVKKYVVLAIQTGQVTIQPGADGEAPCALRGSTFLAPLRGAAATTPQKRRMRELEARTEALLSNPTDFLPTDGGKRTRSASSLSENEDIASALKVQRQASPTKN